tara:strand:+ start:170 stop:1294 length:1125 start_codon:yes stop_codon:yes gene_type:complete
MTVYKPLSADDKVSTKTLLHEAIPITGTIVSGTYSENNIENFTHGMFQSVYDYPYLSSSANHIFDISFGTSADSVLAVTNQESKKDNIYNQMAQVLMGYDKDGNIQKFDEDGDLASGGSKITEAVFLPFSRLLVKDEIKKGSFELELGVSSSYLTNTFNKRIKITDFGAATSYKVNSPAGEYGILYATASEGDQILDSTSVHTASLSDGNTYWRAGLIYYQAGVAVLTSSILATTGAEGGYGFLQKLGGHTKLLDFDGAGETITGSLVDQEITASADNFRHRIYNLQFNNTIELNSTVYFCRVKHNEFNYSSNPTYLTGSQIRVKNETTDIPISYITSIGLYSADNQLLAVGKFSEPIRKDNNIELTFRARLDY